MSDNTMKPSRDIKVLLQILSILRDTENGYVWDKKQTFETIIPYTLEEVYEVIDAIHRHDRDDLCEELGDLLLQIVYYATLASEEKSFDFGDIVYSITAKLIRRHPHLLRSNHHLTEEEHKKYWQEVKQYEKHMRRERRLKLGLNDDTPNGYLGSVKTAQSKQKESVELLNQAAKVGFEWDNIQSFINKFQEEIYELKEAISASDHDTILEEFGDTYFALLNIARKLEIDPDDALNRTNHKFRSRFDYIENYLNDKKTTFEETSLEDMLILWKDAKKIFKSKKYFKCKKMEV
ncbi:nucleoside triphosphate pyrophosphohydrolase [Bartonella tamiae]|uniref:MazG family protein n=1 Tax=Bartonella tamiae Th239 TaxID=1094558 RepID=J1JV07_9HYPH|nr:nucleoside triphosphate pyrophosphohydrolase [Bartonella tamiae]EJF88807.1 MazG family protein [Bartonella tamiae Th239]EJF94943.1 MazG family protein [Bartonella tamiae Th307]